MYAYVYPSLRIYLRASRVRVSMLAFVCVHARVREGVCVSSSVRLSVGVHVRASKCFIEHACVHQCMRSCVYMFESVFPSFRPSVCLSVCLSVRVHVRASKCLFANACVHQCMPDISYFITSYF